MSKLKRLKRNTDFQKVYRYRKSFSSRTTVIYVKPNGEKFNRIGFSISKKVGNSVTRNRIKRFYIEVLITEKEKIKKGYDIVLIARREAAEMDFYTACREIRKVLMKSGLLKGNNNG